METIEGENKARLQSLRNAIREGADATDAVDNSSQPAVVRQRYPEGVDGLVDPSLTGACAITPLDALRSGASRA